MPYRYRAATQALFIQAEKNFCGAVSPQVLAAQWVTAYSFAVQLFILFTT